MNTPLELAAFGLGLVAVFGTAVGGGTAGPEVRFATTAPSAGTYQLFLDFRHGGAVRTAAFTVTTEESGS